MRNAPAMVLSAVAEQAVQMGADPLVEDLFHVGALSLLARSDHR